MTFPYIEFLGLAEERIFRPVIPVSFCTEDGVFNTYCLIDSGSDYTILPIEAAKKFDISLTRDRSYRMQGAGGNEFTIYASPSLINCSIEKRGFRPLTWKSTLYFSESGTLTLLGYKGFFEFVDVDLRPSKRELHLVRKPSMS